MLHPSSRTSLWSPKRSLVMALLVLLAWGAWASHRGWSAKTLNAPEPAFNGTLLTCPKVRQYTQEFLRRHYVFKTLDAQISQRTFQGYVQLLDPGKSFFLESDIEKYRSIHTDLSTLLSNKNCAFIDEIATLFRLRIAESEKLVASVLGSPLTFTAPETFQTDRRKLPWASHPQELQDRWRYLFKFSAIGIAESEGKMPPWDELKTRLEHRYNVIKKSALERTPDEIRGLFMNAFATALDPHSQFLMPEDKDEFKTMFSLQLTGIGAQLSQIDGYTVIDSLLPGGSAERDGRLQKGDKIVGVDPLGNGAQVVDVIDKDLGKVVQLIRGEKGTSVGLTVLRKNNVSAERGVQRLNFVLVRDVVQLEDQQAQSAVVTLPSGKRVGVLLLPSFYVDYDAKSNQEQNYRSSYQDTERELKKLKEQKIDALVVDLRRNGGGDLSECVRLTGLFMDKGPVVQVRDRSGNVDNLWDDEPGALYKGPLVVLVSRQSASASEIFAGAIQDYGRGLVVGSSQTYGKGTVQNVIDLSALSAQGSQNGALKVTISKFYRPSGASNQSRGIVADMVIPHALDNPELSESENEYALPYDTIEPQRRFRPIQNLSSLVTLLKTRSAQRIQASEAFQKILKEAQQSELNRQKTLLPLVWPAPDKPNSGVTLPEKTHLPSKDAVIKDDDIQLHEATTIAADAAELLKKEDWVQP